MNENDLNQYKAIKNEIADLEKRINDTKKAEVVLLGAVKGSSKYFPYIPQTFLVGGIDPADAAQRQKKISELLRQREVQRNELVKKQIEIECYIADINDSTTRTIFRMYFLDGTTQKQIADKTGYDQSIISRKIKGYIKLHKKHKIMC